MKKSKKSVKDLTFSRACVRDSNQALILSQKDNARDTEHTKLLVYNAGKWGHHILMWGSVAIVARMSPREAVAIGADGKWMLGTSSGFQEGDIDASADGPASVGSLRDAKFIGDSIFVVGMRRTAYQRVGTSSAWIRIDKGMRTPPKTFSALHGVDGWTAEAVVAVGSDGEVWRYNGKKWTAMVSPTNFDLHRVRCVNNGEFYACGAAGMLVKGEKDKISIIDHKSTEDNLYAVEWFNNQFYVASLTDLYRLEGTRLVTVDTGLGANVTYGDLHTDGKILWSTGAKHLITSKDGIAWEQIFCT